MPKPTNTPVWDSNATNVVAPTGGQGTDGFATNDVPTSGVVNYLLYWITKWIAYLAAGVFVGTSPTGAAGGAGATGDGGNGDGVGHAGGSGVVGVGGTTNALNAPGGDGGTFTGGNAAVNGDKGGNGVSAVAGAGQAGGAQGGTGGLFTGGQGVSNFGGTGVGGTGGVGDTADGYTGGDGGLFAGGASNGRGVAGVGNGAGAGVDGQSTSGVGGIFKANATRGSVNLVPHTTPSTPGDGDLWVDTTAGDTTGKARVNGATYRFAGHMTPIAVGAFLNSYLAGTVAPRYWIDGFGVVHLSGNVNRATAANLVAFNLPAGYRPASDHAFIAPDTTSGAAVIVSVAANGNVGVNIPNNGDYVSLDGITFETF